MNYRLTPINRIRRALAGVAVIVGVLTLAAAVVAVLTYTAVHLFN